MKIGNGSVELPAMNSKYWTLYGGRYTEVPDEMFGVKLDPDQDTAFDLKMDIKDFKTPGMWETQCLVHEVVREIVYGNPVYIGCKGGWGRTGTIMACLMKAFGYKLPTASLRIQYTPRAVETPAQEDFVRDFEPLKKTLLLIAYSRIMSLFKRGPSLTRAAYD